MIKEIWLRFPQIIQEKINALLDLAEPNSLKFFNLYKSCKREQTWAGNFAGFRSELETFFSIPAYLRKKSDLDVLLDRPASFDIFNSFRLDFHTATVSDQKIFAIADWAHHIMRLNLKTNSPIISANVLFSTIDHLSKPAYYEKSKDFEFNDFCTAWKKIVFKIFGNQHLEELNQILAELQLLEKQLQEEIEIGKAHERTESTRPTIYLTQTELDWVTAVKEAVFTNKKIPKFPLVRGPRKQRLQDLEKTIGLYRIVQSTNIKELLEQRNNIRATILHRCERLLIERFK